MRTTSRLSSEDGAGVLSFVCLGSSLLLSEEGERPEYRASVVFRLPVVPIWSRWLLSKPFFLPNSVTIFSAH